jgi:succinyl-CoA synthetase beta subunit
VTGACEAIEINPLIVRAAGPGVLAVDVVLVPESGGTLG